jgi:hypothetical protein
MNIFSGTIKSKEKTEQTEEGTPEEGRNTNFYPFFDRLSRTHNLLAECLNNNI